MSLPDGTRVGPYEILAPLGAGGMGEVYRALDTRLKREVAIKALPEGFARDVDRLARFQREAELLATLNHPNIGAVYGLETAGATIGLVLELVPGDTLADVIARGPVPLTEALPIARQIAEAIEAAHEKGVIHRDLKPANIKVTPDGVVKVLDFGLAKAMEPGSGIGHQGATRLGDSPTLASPAMTVAGMIVGTAAYMSPEQARGKPVDRRADIWAFGCVLFEMLSGKMAFDSGDTVSDAIAAVLSQEPDWTALPASLPPHVCSVLQRCLQKDPRKRLRDIGDVRLEIDESAIGAATSGAAMVAPTVRSLPAGRLAMAAVAIALVAAGAGGASVWRLRPPAPAATGQVTRFSFRLPEGQRFSRLGHQSVAVSPDGTQIVYVANGRLYVRAMSALEASEIPGTNFGAEHPAFSPDGQSVVFSARADSTLKRIALTGGAPVTIGPAGAVLGLSWARDGSIFFAQEQGARGILRVSANGGTPAVVAEVRGREQAHGPQLLPDGDHLLFTVATNTGAARWDTAQIVVQSIATGERKTLVNGGTDGRYLANGRLVYGLAGVLLSVPFDPARLEIAGSPVPVLEGVRAGGIVSGSMQFSVSDTGSLVYLPGPVGRPSADMELALVDRRGTIARLNMRPAEYVNPRMSPDGSRVAVGIDDGAVSDIWIYELAGTSAMRRLTFGAHNRFPAWSSDSKRIAFQSDRDGDEAIFTQLADGSGSAERLTTPAAGASHAPESWSPDGSRLLFSETQGSARALWWVAWPDRKVGTFGGVRSSEPTNAVFSPDGRWVAYTSTEGGGRRVYVQPFPETGAKYEVPSSAGDIYPLWSADGKELLWQHGADGDFKVVSVTTQPGFAFGNSATVPNPLMIVGPSVQRTLDITPTGALIGMVRPQSATTTPVELVFQVVLNWFEELKARAPVK